MIQIMLVHLANLDITAHNFFDMAIVSNHFS